MTKFIFSFDTEDFTSERAADAITKEAQILTEEGITGCFCIVGLLAEQLERWGRYDVIDALSHHEIANHTYGHSVHPLINEYTDIENAEEAIKRVIETEEKSLSAIKRVFKRDDICAAVPPGNQKSYAAMYAFAKMGLPVFADTFCDTDSSEGVYYCNVFNLAYNRSLEGFLFNDLSDDDMKAVLDELAKNKRVIMYHHPNMAIYSVFWDKLNYYKSNLAKFGEWQIPEERPAEKIEKFYANFRRFARLVKNDGRFELTSYSKVKDEISRDPERTVKKSDVPFIYESLKKNFGPIRGDLPLSIADCVLAVKDFLLGKEEHACGDVYGFLAPPTQQAKRRLPRTRLFAEPGR